MRELIDAIRPYPRTCVWELTARCNLRCLHCASNLGPVASRGRELDAEGARRLCDELASLGCEYAVLSGGEPLLRSDWPGIAARLAGLGVRVGMISNGLLVDGPAVEAMVRSGVSILAVSLDGPAPVHDAIRRRPGSHTAAVAALRRARDAGLRIHAVTHVNRLNRDQLDALREEVEAIGVRTWLVQLAAPWGRLRQHAELVLLPEELPDLARWIARTRERSRLYLAVGDNIGYYTELEPALRRRRPDDPLPFWCGCSAGVLTLGIEANGNVKGCLSLQSERFVEGNVRERSLREIWQDPALFRYTRGFESGMLRGACRDCEYGEICRGGCTFMSVGATGEPAGSPYCLHRLSKA